MVPVVESAPSAQVPTILTSLPTPPSSSHHQTHHNHHHTKTDATPTHRHHTTTKNTTRKETVSTDTRENGLPSLTHRLSHESLTQDPSHHDTTNTERSVSHDVSGGGGIGSNTESQEDLLDNTCDKNTHNRRTMGEKSNSGSKVADLICNYEETAKLSQSSSESVKVGRVEGEGERVGRGKVGRVMSMVTEHALDQPQTLILHEVYTY